MLRILNSFIKKRLIAKSDEFNSKDRYQIYIYCCVLSLSAAATRRRMWAEHNLIVELILIYIYNYDSARRELVPDGVDGRSTD